MIVAGVGYRKNVLAADLKRAIELTLREYGVPQIELARLAAPPVKAHDLQLSEAAAALGVETVIVDGVELKRQTALLSSSSASYNVTGSYCASEAAALAAAGPGAVLLGARMVWGAVTCALASTAEEP